MSFQFKQFIVEHDKCAMKVNTDGVLLGAWQNTMENGNILDIGTGSGVIALMMAQKNPLATIDAIDIDEDAFNQTRENFSNSRWHNRLTAAHCAVQDYKPNKTYNLIISNPPYFIADMKTADAQKNIARHSVALNYEALIANIARLLSDCGKALISIPAFNLAVFGSLAETRELFITRLAKVFATGGKPAYLALLQLERVQKPVTEEIIQIQHENGDFTAQCRELTGDFYLKF